MNEQEIREKIKELLIDSLGIEAEVLTDDVPLSETESVLIQSTHLR